MTSKILSRWTLALSLLFSSLASGCAHSGNAPADPAAPAVDAHAIARSIVLCKTTEADLRSQLGEPTRDGLLRNARIVSWITGESSVVSYLAVLLDERGVVVDLYWNLPTEIPWVPSDQCR